MFFVGNLKDSKKSNNGVNLIWLLLLLILLIPLIFCCIICRRWIYVRKNWRNFIRATFKKKNSNSKDSLKENDSIITKKNDKLICVNEAYNEIQLNDIDTPKGEKIINLRQSIKKLYETNGINTNRNGINGEIELHCIDTNNDLVISVNEAYNEQENYNQTLNEGEINSVDTNIST